MENEEDDEDFIKDFEPVEAEEATKEMQEIEKNTKLWISVK